MIPKSILDQAKSFLCWDEYTDLTIKLIELQPAVGFFYPPETKLSTIIIYYDKNCRDFTIPLFLLFHESGHYQQYQVSQQIGTTSKFNKLINLDKGDQKIAFEREAWQFGATMFNKFIQKYDINIPNLINEYFIFADRCLVSYY